MCAVQWFAALKNVYTCGKVIATHTVEEWGNCCTISWWQWCFCVSVWHVWSPGPGTSLAILGCRHALKLPGAPTFVLGFGNHHVSFEKCTVAFITKLLHIENCWTCPRLWHWSFCSFKRIAAVYTKYLFWRDQTEDSLLFRAWYKSWLVPCKPWIAGPTQLLWVTAFLQQYSNMWEKTKQTTDPTARTLLEKIVRVYLIPQSGDSELI